MMFLLGLLRPFALKLLMVGAIALAVLAVLFGARRSGVMAERADQFKRERKAIHERREVEDEVERLAPDARRERLRRWSRRDSV